MNRRDFLMTSSCFLATPAVALAAQAYAPGLVKQLLSEGKTVFVDYTTEWCTTCAAQKRTDKSCSQKGRFCTAQTSIR